MEESLVSDHILNFFLQFSTHYVLAVDSYKRILYANNQAKKLFGSVRQGPSSVIAQHIAITQPSQVTETIAYADKEVMIQWHLYPCARKDNSAILLCIGEDITELSALKTSLATLNYIIERVPGFVFWKDKNLKLMGCNDNFAKQVGLRNPRDIVGLSDYDLPWETSQTERFLQDDQEVLNTGLPKLNIEEKQRQLDGKDMFLLTNKVPLYDKGEVSGVLGIYLDVTKFKEMHIAKEKAESASALKSNFMLNMQHDIRTPISGICGVSELLIDLENDPEIKSNLGEIALAARELLDYCNDIIDFSNVEYGSQAVLNKPFHLQKLLESVASMEQPAAKLKKINFQLEMPNIPEVVLGDAYRIKRILINLVSNAIKFTDSGYVKLGANVLPPTDASRSVVINFSVADSGIGIAAEKLDFIYEKFSKLTPSNKEIYKGSGLGLRIVKQFVEDLDGDIYVTSEVNKGTLFNVFVSCSIPLCKDILAE